MKALGQRMAFEKALIFHLVVLSGPAVADDCDQQESMPAVRRCLIETTVSAMEAAYHAALPKLATDEARKALEASQAAFIEYRYQSCTVVYEAYKQLGWIAEDHATTCVTRLNMQRQEFLLGIPEAG